MIGQVAKNVLGLIPVAGRRFPLMGHYDQTMVAEDQAQKVNSGTTVRCCQRGSEPRTEHQITLEALPGC